MVLTLSEIIMIILIIMIMIIIMKIINTEEKIMLTISSQSDSTAASL